MDLSSIFAHSACVSVSRPVEVIAVTVAVLGLLYNWIVLIIIRSISKMSEANILPFQLNGKDEFWNSTFASIITLFRCILLLWIYQQFQRVQQLFSHKVAVRTASLASCSMVFSFGLVRSLNLGFSEWGDATLFFLVYMDVIKLGGMVDASLETVTSSRFRTNLTNLIARLGPLLTFEVCVQMLIISVGLISGIHLFHVLASLMLLATLTNYIVALTLFPASLSLIFESSPPQITKIKTGDHPTTSFSLPLLNVANGSPTVPPNLHNGDTSWTPALGHLSPPVTEPRPLDTLAHGIQPLPRNRKSPWLDDDKSESTMTPIFKLLIGGFYLLLQILGFGNGFRNMKSAKVETQILERETMAGTMNGTDKDVVFNDTFSFVMSCLVPRLDSVIILSLVVILVVKFLFYDSKSKMAQYVDESSGMHGKGTPIQRVRPVVSSKTSISSSSSSQDSIYRTKSGDMERKRTFSGNIAFTVGESESDSEVETSRCIVVESTGVQTNESYIEKVTTEIRESREPRSVAECTEIYETSPGGATNLSDEEILKLVRAKKIPAYQLEKAVQNEERGVVIRRKLVAQLDVNAKESFQDIPYEHYDYSKITGACCENVVGFIPVPLGVVGPLVLDGKKYQVPMATTEGCLVASTNRGCRALANGIHSRIVGDGMTRGPVVRFPSGVRACEAAVWLQDSENFAKLKESFDSTSRFARLQSVSSRAAGRYLFIRFVAKTGDAMGMNMISKGTEVSLSALQTIFPDMEILSLSGNFCTDKKPAAVNWIEGRGKSVVAEAVVPANIIRNTLKTSVGALVELNIAKNLVGSAMAGSIGGFNAHAANIVAGIYIATGQDAAQVVGSSNCMTLMEPWGQDGQDLYISCTMPSIEVGTVGGGTCLPPQLSCLKMLGVNGPNYQEPGDNARSLARIVCATVLAGELSLMSALAAGHLVRSHLKHNRSTANIDSMLRSVSTSPASFASLDPSRGGRPAQKRLSTHLEASELVLPKFMSAAEGNNNNNNTKEIISSEIQVPLKTMDLLSVPTECNQF